MVGGGTSSDTVMVSLKTFLDISLSPVLHALSGSRMTEFSPLKRSAWCPGVVLQSVVTGTARWCSVVKSVWSCELVQVTNSPTTPPALGEIDTFCQAKSSLIKSWERFSLNSSEALMKLLMFRYTYIPLAVFFYFIKSKSILLFLFNKFSECCCSRSWQEKREMFLRLFLLLSLASHRGFQFSTTENEIPDDRSIVTIKKSSRI